MNDKNQRITHVFIILLYLILLLFFCFLLSQHVYIKLPCVFNLITGLKCPGCGTTRMVISLSGFDFSSAFNYNPGVFIILPFLIFLFFNTCITYINTGKININKKYNNLIYVLIIYLIIYSVIRNIYNF